MTVRPLVLALIFSALLSFQQGPDELASVALQQEKIQLPMNVHFTAEGYGQMADLASLQIARVFPPRSRP